MVIKTLIVLALAAIAFGNPITSSKDDLKLKAKELLEKIQVLKHDMKNLDGQRLEIQGQVFDSGVKIDQFLNENSKVLETKEILEKGTSNGKNVKQCREVFDRVLFWTSRSLKQTYYDIAEPDLQALELSLMFMNAQLEEIKQKLETNLDKILEQCERESTKCKLTGVFSKDVKQVSETVESVKPVLPKLIDLSLEKVEKEILPEEVQSRFREIEGCFEKVQ